ncbi:hypothetical protein [Bacillus sp. CDB3]|uniref:hypothetical protein n=1 Tax=Bacillus sp. CDB3 TaxID=360310 RepID=UPI0009D9137B|nr:hypothetical protein [Bacillus sp. CDB3]OQR53270.1 hypothetical protein CDB3_30955 [Bacillus sp. CDB3]
MLKQKMMKVALCGAIATGVVGSLEVIKPSQASAQGQGPGWGEHFAKQRYDVISSKRLPDTTVYKVDEVTDFARTQSHTAKFAKKEFKSTTTVFGVAPGFTATPLKAIMDKLGIKFEHTINKTMDMSSEFGQHILVRNPDNMTALARCVEGTLQSTQVVSKNGYGQTKTEIVKTFVPNRKTLVVVEMDSLLNKEIKKYQDAVAKSGKSPDQLLDLSLDAKIYESSRNLYR